MLTRIALKFRVITLLILALVIASGIWSASKLQLELLPDVEFPLFTVFTYYEDGAPLDVLDDVTIPSHKGKFGANECIHGNGKLSAWVKGHYEALDYVSKY